MLLLILLGIVILAFALDALFTRIWPVSTPSAQPRAEVESIVHEARRTEA